jgi:autotransporter-associated beta strand protein
LTNEWHHVTATYDANTDIRRLFIDGTLIATGGNPGLNNATSTNFAVGRSTITPGTEYFAGFMSELLIARSALTQAQIQTLINSGVTFGSFTGGGGALSPNSQVQVASGATLDLNGVSSSSGGLGNVSGSGGLVTSSSAGSIALGLNPVGTATFGGVIENGAGTVGITKSGAGTQVLTGANTYSGLTTITGGALVLGLAAHGPVLGSGPGANVQGGRIVFDYNGGAEVATQVKSILTAGFNQPTKFSSGAIYSSTATANIGLGYIHDAGAKLVTVARAYYGDANLDGTVNALDFNALATNFASGSAQWIQGDFNYDGTVNSLDFNALAGNFGQSLPLPAPALAASALVPEPGSVTLFAVACGLLCQPRRRRAAL